MKIWSWRIPFQEQVKFLKSGIWFQFYNTSNKDTFFWLTRYNFDIFSTLAEICPSPKLWAKYYILLYTPIRLLLNFDYAKFDTSNF